MLNRFEDVFEQWRDLSVSGLVNVAARWCVQMLRLINRFADMQISIEYNSYCFR